MSNRFKNYLKIQILYLRKLANITSWMVKNINFCTQKDASCFQVQSHIWKSLALKDRGQFIFELDQPLFGTKSVFALLFEETWMQNTYLR